jgi:hypothetical protein
LRHVETLKGNGTVTTKGGDQQAVRYVLQVYEAVIPTGKMTGSATLPGFKDIRGRVEPLCFFNDRDLTLTLKDGRKVRFWFIDGDGNISLYAGLPDV